MDKLTRRSLLRTLAGGALTTLGTVVVARAAVTDAAATAGAVPLPAGDLSDRALRVAEELGEEATTQVAQWLNLGIPGIFGNGGFGNGFRNGGFGNGGFRNGGFRNGGFRNGGFRNGGFRNGFRNF